ncbi:MAG: hypothetical protein M3Y51_01135 [Actinomycetota bacterium]|nr:hypothetical protein [Actinomycetota bacterium]
MVLALFVGLGVMWLTSAGASAADGADHPTLELQERAAPLLEAPGRVLRAAEPALQPVEPVLAHVAQATQPTVSALEPVATPVVRAVTAQPIVAPVIDEVVAPALTAIPTPALPGLPPTLVPELPLLPVDQVAPTVPVPVSDALDAAAPGEASRPGTADVHEHAEPATTAPMMDGRRDLRTASGDDDTTISAELDASVTARDDAPTAPRGPVRPERSAGAVPAPTAGGSGADRQPTLGVLSTEPRAGRCHSVPLHADAADPRSQPSPLPPVAPD